MMIKPGKPEKKSAHKRLLVTLVLIGIGMFGFGYAMVPLYNTFCSVLGINGKTGGPVVYNEKNAVVDMTRTITVEFLTTNNESLPWTFHPNKTSIEIHPGEQTKVTFFAKNNADKVMTVQAIPSVTPGIAAKYLKKTECFCFTAQTLKSHDARDMPVLFHLDPKLPKNINTVTLSYTLFDVTGK